jgi:hypothetical protein
MTIVILSLSLALGRRDHSWFDLALTFSALLRPGDASDKAEYV